MYKKRTHIWSMLLVAVLLLSLLPATALAASEGVTCTDTNCTHEAAVTTSNGTTLHYVTIADAIHAAGGENGTGGTVTLLKEGVTLQSEDSATTGTVDTYSTFIYKDIILDLNGKTLKCNASYAGISVRPGVHFTIKNGTFENISTDQWASAIEASKSADVGGIGCTIILEEQVTVKANYSAVYGVGYTEIEVSNSTVEGAYAIYGAGPTNSVTLRNAEVTGSKYGVYQGPYAPNVFMDKDVDGSIYEIYDSTIKGGDDYAGVCINNYVTNVATGNHTLLVENSDITGGTGIETKRTDVTIQGEDTVITATGSEGMTPGCKPVSGGYAVAAAYYDSEAGAMGTLNISGGTFNGAVGIQEPATTGTNPATPATITITGGTFTDDVDTYVAPGMTQDENGSIIVNPETAEARINNVNYITLADALNYAVSGNTVILLKDEVDLEEEIPEGVILEVSSGQSLKIAAEKLATLIGSQGKIRVNAGGALDVGGTKMIGGSNANISLTQGYIDVSNHESALMLEFIGATTEVPVDHRWTLSKEITTGTSIPINVSMDEDTTLTVNSTGADGEDDGLRIANGSTLTNNGKVTVNGVMSISSQGKVEGSGTITVNKGGVLMVNQSNDTNTVGTLDNAVTNSGTFVWNGTSGAPSENITLASGGKVYSKADIQSKLSGSKRTLSDKNYNGTEYAYAWEYYVASTTSGGSSTTTYTATVESTANGTVSVSPKNAAKGATVTVTVTPDEGYALDSLTATDADGNTVELKKVRDTQYTFTMPASKVTVKAVFAEEEVVSSLPFTDVNEADWFYHGVKYAYENALMKGTGETVFEPGTTLSRGMIAQVLYNLEQNPSAGSGAFSDVAEGVWYADAVNWAASNEIVSGYGEGIFGPEKAISREEMASILYRYAGYKGYDTTARGDLSVFDDGGTTSEWAEEAMIWATGAGLLSGKGEGKLDPAGTATRAEVAQILMTFCENVIK